MSVNNHLENSFQKNLAFGQIAETSIAKWITRRGGLVLPIYDIEYETGKGPRLFGESRDYIAPDLLVIKRTNNTPIGEPTWIEAKHKSVCTWYRIKQQWETGIDLNHYEHYLKVADVTGWKTWLLFLHRCETPDSRDVAHGCPELCPIGLFGHTIEFLKDNTSHKSNRHGRSGMVYWAIESLKKLATLKEIITEDQ